MLWIYSKLGGFPYDSHTQRMEPPGKLRAGGDFFPQPWVIQDLMPTGVAISAVPEGSVKFTFWMFAAIFTALLVAEISIMLRYINSASKKNIETTD